MANLQPENADDRSWGWLGFEGVDVEMQVSKIPSGEFGQRSNSQISLPTHSFSKEEKEEKEYESMATSPYLTLARVGGRESQSSHQGVFPQCLGLVGIVTDESEAHVRTPGSDSYLGRSQTLPFLSSSRRSCTRHLLTAHFDAVWWIGRVDSVVSLAEIPFFVGNTAASFKYTFISQSSPFLRSKRLLFTRWAAALSIRKAIPY